MVFYYMGLCDVFLWTPWIRSDVFDLFVAHQLMEEGGTIHQVMLAYSRRIIDVYCGNVQSQKKALLQRTATALFGSGFDSRTGADNLEELFDIVTSQSHMLYREGVDVLRLSVTSAPLYYVERFEALLQAFLQDIVAFDLIAGECVAALQGHFALSPETLRSYTHGAVVMPFIQGGNLFEDHCRALVAADAL
jgi:hypothetical protein